MGNKFYRELLNSIFGFRDGELDHVIFSEESKDIISDVLRKNLTLNQLAVILLRLSGYFDLQATATFMNTTVENIQTIEHESLRKLISSSVSKNLRKIPELQ